MIIAVEELTDFPLTPTAKLHAYIRSWDNTTLENAGYDADKIFICMSILQTGALTFKPSITGTPTSVGNGFIEDDTKAWTIDEHIGVVVVTNIGTFTVTSNTAIQLNFTGDATGSTTYTLQEAVKLDSGTWDALVLANSVLSIPTGSNAGNWIITAKDTTTVARISGDNAVVAESAVTFYVPDWEEFVTETALLDEYRTNETWIRTAYLGKDYETFRDETLAWMKKSFGSQFNDFVSSSGAIMLVEVFAYMLDTLSWYLDMRANETFMESARLKNSIIKLARFLGYKDRAATAASVDLSITLDQAYGFDVPFPAGHQITTDNGIVYELAAGVTVLSGQQGPVTPSAVEGETSLADFTSTGLANQKFELGALEDGTFIPNGSVVVKVDGVAWTEKATFDYAATDQFIMEYGADVPYIKMGDGIVGNIPVSAASIQITFRVCHGEAGLVGSGTIINGGSLVVSGQTIAYTVTNPLGSSGGANAETVESIRVNAPKKFLTSERAVTQGDWDTLSSQFSDPTHGSIAVAKAKVLRGIEVGSNYANLFTAIRAGIDLGDWTGTEKADLLLSVADLESLISSTMANYIATNHVVIYALTLDSNGFYTNPSASLKTALHNDLETKRLITVTHEIADGSNMLIGCGADITISVNPRFTPADVSASVKSAVEALLKGRAFGTDLTVHDIHSVIDGIAGVTNARITITSTSFSSMIVNGDLIIEDKHIITKESATDAVDVTVA